MFKTCKMKYVFLVTISVLMASCAANHHHGKLEKPDLEEVVEPVSIYRIGIGDSLTVSVWKNGDLGGGGTVRPDGKISVPLIGDIHAAGLTAEELAEIVEKQLSNYIRNPQVTVIITGTASAQYLRRIRIAGAVGSPQSIEHYQGITVFDAILQAGGPNPFAKSNETKLYRKTKDGVMKIYPIKLRDILEEGQLETNYLLMPSDIISVPERAF